MNSQYWQQRDYPPRRYPSRGPPPRSAQGGRGRPPPRGHNNHRPHPHPRPSRYPARRDSYRPPSPPPQPRSPYRAPQMEHNRYPREETFYDPTTSPSRFPTRDSSPETPKAVREDSSETGSSSSKTVSPPKPPPEAWRLGYFLEQARLSAGPESKPRSIYFFTDDRTKGVTESRSSARKFTSAYSPEEIFGTAAERSAHVRALPVTFSQIWKREMIVMKWENMSQDYDGSLVIDGQECKAQLQRHHIPGTLFCVPEGGNLDINFNTPICPDVYYRLVDAEGQEFKRPVGHLYDLKRRVEIAVGQQRVAFMGIDGTEIQVEIVKGEQFQRVTGHGMPRKYDGTNRGDLILEFVTIK